MIKNFLIERRSWILLFICLQCIIILISYLDSAIPIRSILYIVYLSMVIFIIFLVIRYKKETKFYQSILEWENNLDLTSITHAESPFEKIIERKITSQTEVLKQENTTNQMVIEKEKDDLLAWIHEVKTPLTAMKLMIDSMDVCPDKNKLALEWLRIHHLLDQQLHQKRMLSIENDLFIENVDLRTVLFKEIKELQSWCMQKGIGFEVELNTPSVISDGKWLAFIIKQLLTNAVKYSEASDITITAFQQDGKVIVTVTDYGRGIAPKDLPRIFDKGFTSTTKHLDQAATGMGLYLAKKAARPLLIKMEVHSKVGQGTTFTLTFPKGNDFNNIIGM